MFALIEIFGVFFFLFWMTLSILAFAFWIWMLVDAIQNKGLSDVEKICWVLAIIFLNFIAALLYFFLARSKRNSPVHT